MNPMDFPLLVLVLSFVFLFLAAHIGDLFRNRVFPMREEVRDDFGVVLGATLTLLALLIGFSFSMAVSRYDHGRITKRPRPTRSAPSTCGPICCLPWTQRECTSC